MVLEKVKMILSNQFDVEEDSITPETNIADDLGADSLDAVELNIALEEQLGLSIADEDRPNMKTVGDIVRYLEALEGTKDNRI